MSRSQAEAGSRDRREVVKAGAGALAMLAGLGVGSIASAQDASPTAAVSRDLNGYFGITRSYTVADDADVQELIDKVEGFVEIISAVPGFSNYVLLYSDSSRVWTAISIFDTAENANASTDAASEYVADNELGSYFVDPTPVVVDGSVILNAGF